jgi:hypothetical protein
VATFKGVFGAAVGTLLLMETQVLAVIVSTTK